MISENALVPADSHIMIHLYDVHRDPNFWTDPDKFDPDRFLPERSKNQHPFAYLPFSAGPRNCIGNTDLNYISKYKIFLMNFFITLYRINEFDSKMDSIFIDVIIF